MEFQRLVQRPLEDEHAIFEIELDPEFFDPRRFALEFHDAGFQLPIAIVEVGFEAAKLAIEFNRRLLCTHGFWSFPDELGAHRRYPSFLPPMNPIAAVPTVPTIAFQCRVTAAKNVVFSARPAVTF